MKRKERVVNKNVAVAPLWNKYNKKNCDIGVLNGYKSGDGHKQPNL